MNWKKYLIGFGMFMIYYLVARNIENRVAIIKKAAGTSA